MVRLRVKYIPTGSPLPETLEEGMLYFVESQNTIWKDGDKPFSGINNVSFEVEGTKTKILFNTDGGNDGNAGSIVVGNAQLDSLVHELDERMYNAEDAINSIEFRTTNILNLDVVAPSAVPYNLTSAIQYLLNLRSIEYKNLAVLFNDGAETQLYFFKGNDRSQLTDESKWENTHIGSGEEVQRYNTRSAFPAVGKKNVLYIDRSSNELWFWDDATVQYHMCGFDPSNIKLIDTNF